MLRALPRHVRTLFAWSSAVSVAACGVVAQRGSHARIMAAEPAMESFGLTYFERSGATLACAEAALVLGAWWCAQRRGFLALPCGWGLVAWAALWTANALRWLLAAPDALSLGVSTGLVVVLLCSVLATRPPRIALAE